MKNILLGVTTAVLFGSFVNISFAATTDWGNLSENVFIQTVTDTINNSSSLRATTTNGAYAYKKVGDKKTLFYVASMQAGSFYKSNSSSSLAIGSSTIYYETGKSKPKDYYSMSVISDGQNIFFKPDGLKYKPLRNKWIKATSSEQYNTIGGGLGVANLFNVFDSSTDTKQQKRLQKVIDAQTKTGLWLRYDEIIEDNRAVPNATRYNFELDPDAIKPFFTELTRTLTLQEAGYGMIANKNFMAQLSNEDVTDSMWFNSFMSVWIDKVSNKPVRLVNAIWVPVIERNKTTYVLNLVETEISGYDLQPKLQIPATSTDAFTAAKLLKIKLGS